LVATYNARPEKELGLFYSSRWVKACTEQTETDKPVDELALALLAVFGMDCAVFYVPANTVYR